jgi:N-acylneuraminate cytidylyltransferase
MNLICIIPAKGRSTRLPGKNGLRVAGVPLVVRAVRTAADSGLFAAVVVSTDDARLAALAVEAGAEAPFLREEALTRDGIEVDAVVRQALLWLEQRRAGTFQWVCTLQPTSPLRTVEDVRASWALLRDDPTADGVTSVSPYGHHPFWALHLTRGALRPERPDLATRSRTSLTPLYHPDGCIYWQRVADVLAQRPPYDGRILAYLTPAASAVDVDQAEDLAYAEFLLQRQQSETAPCAAAPPGIVSL